MLQRHIACIYNYYCKSHFRQIYTQLRSFDFISKKVETLQMADGGTWVSLFRNICHFLRFFHWKCSDFFILLEIVSDNKSKCLIIILLKILNKLSMFCNVWHCRHKTVHQCLTLSALKLKMPIKYSITWKVSRYPKR